ncbi:MAG: hypothetical protein V4484_16505 [Pseudomonadota bacterium]
MRGPDPEHQQPRRTEQRGANGQLLARQAGALAIAVGDALRSEQVLVAALMVLGGASHAGAFSATLLPIAAKVALGCVPVLAIQHAVSWRYQNQVLPLAGGVSATMGITQIGSSGYWVYYP